MKNSSLFNYNLLFGDHMAKVSDKAKLYYIKLCFYANNGFVPNPLSVLDSMGYDKGVFQELVNNGELLTRPNRCEVFITAYFVHNKIDPSSWTHTIYYPYWKGYFWIKRNGVATLKPQTDEKEEVNEVLDKPAAKSDNDDIDMTEEEIDELLKWTFKD